MCYTTRTLLCRPLEPRLCFHEGSKVPYRYVPDKMPDNGNVLPAGSLSKQLRLEFEAQAQLSSSWTPSVLRQDPPLQYAGEGAATRELDVSELDHRQGYLRVRVLAGEGLPARADGRPCVPFTTITLAQLTKRHTQRIAAHGSGPDVSWNEHVDFDSVSACSQVIVDVWDEQVVGGPPDLLGKVVLSLSNCRAGVPHTYFKHLLEGKIVLRLLFDTDPLPSAEEEEEGIEAILGGR